MKAFVTGAAGLLGTNLIRALRWEGHRVSALISASADSSFTVADSGVRIVRGSAEEPSEWLKEVGAAEVLFYAAPPGPGVAVISGGEEEWPVCALTTAPMIGPGDLSGSV
jgi:nucleoside-diphosphate-sugar epimerase